MNYKKGIIMLQIKCPFCKLDSDQKVHLDCEDKDGKKIRWIVNKDVYLKIQKLIKND